MSVVKTIQKAGRKYVVDSNGASDVSASYQVVLSEPLDIDALPTSFTGVPAIGANHPNRRGYRVARYEVTQPEGKAKSTLDIKVVYAPQDVNADPLDPTKIDYVLEWGWDDGTGERELVVAADANHTPVVNSAGDVFANAPRVTEPTPTFTKRIRSSVRQEYAQYLCAVNAEAVTIGAMVCAPRTLLCTVAERKYIGEEYFPFEYTIKLRYRSNVVHHESSATDEEVGWDAAIVDAGMRQLVNGRLELIEIPSSETRQPCTVTSPELLDGQGHAQDRTSTAGMHPVVLVFQAYKRVTFPEWFYSEPPTPAPPPEEEET